MSVDQHGQIPFSNDSESMIRIRNHLPLLAIYLALSACDIGSGNEETQAVAPAAPPPLAVTTVSVKTQDIPVQYEYVGQVAGSLEVEVRSRITGIIEKRHYREGSRARSGQLLFSLDDKPFKAEYQQALAAIELARAQKVTAEAQLKQAERELKRVTPLAKKQMLSQDQKDVAASEVDIATAQLAVAEAAIKQAEANMLSAEINLEYTQIRSPIDGITGRALLNRGALVQAASNSLLTTMVQTNPAHINFGIPENDQLRIRRELAQGTLLLPANGFRIDLHDANGQPLGHNGQLDFQDYKVDNNTGNFAMRATMPNDDQSLSPGQFVRVILKGAQKIQAIALPQRAVLDGPGGKYVYVVSDGENGIQIAMQKNVVPGEWVSLGDEQSNQWIIRSGLEVGDQVIVDGVARIFFPGMPVSIDNGSGQSTPQASAAQH